MADHWRTRPAVNSALESAQRFFPWRHERPADCGIAPRSLDGGAAGETGNCPRAGQCTCSYYGQVQIRACSLCVYHSYARNTHAHTSYTWSHGDRYSDATARAFPPMRPTATSPPARSGNFSRLKKRPFGEPCQTLRSEKLVAGNQSFVIT